MVDEASVLLLELWPNLIWPLTRLLFFISVGLLIATAIESLNWTKKIAIFARPLARHGHFSEQVAGAFSIAMVSGVTANTMLSESYTKGEIRKQELVLANLFNSLPTYFLHLPTLFVIAFSMIKGAAFIYVGLTLSAALFRTISIVFIGRILLKKPTSVLNIKAKDNAPPTLTEFFAKVKRRFVKRIRKIASFTVPIYVIIYTMNRLEYFEYLESVIASYIHFLPLLSPQAIGIITLQMVAEMAAGLAAAGALLNDGVLSQREIIVALMIGNILSSPLRAFRHQFPYYAGIFTPRLALELISYNQSFRALSLVIMTALYLFLA